MKHPGLGWATVLLVILAASSAWAQAPRGNAAHRPPKAHVLLLNGGAQPRSNYLSHLHHLQDMVKVLGDRGLTPGQITIFSADGEDEAPDLAARTPLPRQRDLWLVQSTWVGKQLLPKTKLKNTTWEGVKMKPATYQALRSWFQGTSTRMGPRDTLLIFVTDHGTRGKRELNNGNIALWKESMSVLEFRALLGYLSKDQKAVMVMSQCYSGTFARAMYTLGDAAPTGNTCGFFSTQRDRFAYGCYPEGRGREKIGYAFQFIDAMTRHQNFTQAHEEVMLHDDSPDVPLRSSDVFLRDLIQRQAKRKHIQPETLTDQLLAKAQNSPKRWAQERDLITGLATYAGLSAPQTLTTLTREGEEMSALLKRSEETADLWKDSYGELKKSLLKRYLASKKGKKWAKKLKPKRLKGFNEEDRVELLGDFIEDWRDALKESKQWDHLRKVRGKANRAGALRYRMQKREAVRLRMRALLLRVAGMTALDQREPGFPKQDREAFESLARCEATALGRAPGSDVPDLPKNLPSFAQDMRTLQSLLPSWLGINFKPLNEEEARRNKVSIGAVQVLKISPGSPAQAAGLKKGDLLLGSGEVRFSLDQPIREWVMVAPQDKVLPLEVMRAGKKISAQMTLAPHPLKVSFKAPKVGQNAPALSPVAALDQPKGFEPGKKSYALFFWATWCKPCQAMLPQILAWGESQKIAIVLVSDEPESVQRAWRQSWKGPTPPWMLLDVGREVFRSHVIYAPSALVHVDASGRIERRLLDLKGPQDLTLPGL